MYDIASFYRMVSEIPVLHSTRLYCTPLIEMTVNELIGASFTL